MTADSGTSDGPLDGREGLRVAVIGAGAVGTTAAYDLTDRGAAVTVYERAASVGAGGSTGRAAGLIHDAYADRTDGTVATRAIERFREWSSEGETEDGFEFVETPYLRLAREGDDRRADAIREQTDAMDGLGVEIELLSSDELADRYPALRTDDVAVAAVATTAGYADPGAFAQAIAVRAQEAGAEVRTGVEARLRVDSDGPVVEADRGEADRKNEDRERFDAVLVAAGPRTKQVLTDAGIATPLKPYRVQALTTTAGPSVPMVFDATGGFYLRPHGNGILFGNGTEERESDPETYDRIADDSFVRSAHERVAERVAGSVGETADAWAGQCVATPDGYPLVGSLREGVFVAAGWHGHGFMRAPATGELAAEAVLGAAPVREFDPRRFDGDEEFSVVEGMSL